MNTYIYKSLVVCALAWAVLTQGAFAATVIDHTSTNIASIPDQWITQAKDSLHIAYQHTSHGSQLITGMNALQAFPDYGTKYSWTEDGTAGTLDLDDYGIPGCDDLSQGDYLDADNVTPWVTATRALLNNPANSHINVIVWSWCSINGHNAQRYVDNMEILVAQYPTVKFVFMTGHAEGQGEDMTPNSVHYNNQLIRQHCASHDRILFDFADIEAYNPDGTYFWDQAMYDNLDYTGGNWAVQWIAANPNHELTKLTTGTTGYSGCTGCAHSDDPTQANLNCVLKARAAWWLWARLAGWDGQTGGTTTTTSQPVTTTTSQPVTTTTIQQATTTIAPVTTTVPATTTIGGTTTTTPVTTTAPATTSTITPITTTVPATTTIGGTTTTTINGTTTTTPVTTTVSATTTTIAPITTTVPPTTTIVVITTTIGGTTTTAPVTTTVPATTTTTAPGTTTVPVTTTIGGTTTSTISDNTTSTTTTPAACSDKDADGYGDNCTAGPDCNDNDSLYNEVCPDCTVTVIPGSLGWFLGEKEKTRRLLVIGNKGTEFAEATPVRWETDAIAVLSKRVLFKRFMLIKVRIDGEALGKGDYRALIGTCSGKLTLVK